MQRRDFVKAMMAASVAAKAALGQQAPAAAAAQQAPVLPPRAPLAPGPVPWMEGLMEAKPLPITALVPDAIAQTNVHFFNESQMAALRRLSEVLMPPLKGYPGATEAGTPEFLDFLIGVSPPDRQQTYRSGLDRLDEEAKRKFGVAFAAVNAEQADRIIRPWLRTWMPDHPPTEGFAHFINQAHTDIRFATENSQAWNDAEIASGKTAQAMDAYWYPVDPDMRREAQLPTHRPGPGPQLS
jgi:hypothetical protein